MIEESQFLGIWPKELKSGSLKRYTYSCFRCGIIHNNKDVETTEMPTGRWTNTEDVVYTCGRTSLNHNKGNVAIYDNMDELCKYYTRRKEPDTEG